MAADRLKYLIERQYMVPQQSHEVKSYRQRPERRFFLTLREAKEFAAHMRRRYDDHARDSTYLSRDGLGEAAKAYDLIREISEITGKPYTHCSK